jgi:hypothetical protein
MRLTVGPLPASVYWRRRVIVLGAALLLVFLVAQACIAASAAPGDDPGAAPPPTGGTTPSPPPATPPVGGASSEEPPDGGDDRSGDPPLVPPAGDGEICADDEMRITAAAQPAVFSPGEEVRLAIRIRNDSDRTCRRDIGGDLRELWLIHGTGADKIFSSQHCGGPSGSNDAVLGPGHEEEYHLAWHGRTSSICDGDEPGGPIAEPGEYRLYARLGHIHSEPVELTIR